MDSNWFLHYPVWDLDLFGGGFWIALMAVVHVYVAHFAVGGGLFLVLTEMKSYRENSPDIYEYTRKHTKFFLLLTAVFGSVTGVGIWFVISVLSPQATSTLIHSFVFGWATEWVFFLGEIITLFVYFYTFGKMGRSKHLQVGWFYFIFGWLSLFVVNGIISYMLTPGQWLTTRNFWDGFLNPTFWPSTAFRTSMSFMLAGLFGFITALFIPKEELREQMFRYCAKWLLIPIVFLAATGGWYIAALPDAQKTMILSHSPEAVRFLKAFLWMTPVLFSLGLLMVFRASLTAKRGVAVLLVFWGLAYMGAFEWVRESGRRPFLIYGYTWSSGLHAADADAVRKAGILKSTRWARYQEITDDNRMEAGRDLFKFSCSACHSVGGPMNDILTLSEKYSRFGMEALLDGMGKLNTYMPPFLGTEAERKALAAYIVEGLHRKSDAPPAEIAQKPVEMPPFDENKDEYLLTAWNGRGMYCISDNEAYLSFSAPGNDMYAMLVKRGPSPERIMEGATLSYQIEKGFGQPSAHSLFWQNAAVLTGKEIAPDTGLSGKKINDVMNFDDDLSVYAAKGVPVVPYSKDGKFNPYPLMTIEAKDKAGKLLASTRITAPVSTEMNCKLCHGGEWRMDGKAGMGDGTARNILKTHDRMNRTDLLASAEKGKPVLCQSCHADGKGEPLNLSAALHGFHANYLTDRGPEACASCHPGWPAGITRAFRGIHREVGLDCTNCHGPMEDHALSLLKAEQKAGKKAADKLMAHLIPRAVDAVEKINPRTPWVNQPDCLTCHVNFSAPEVTEAFNQWTEDAGKLYRNRTGEAGVMCMACHGSTHAIYPAVNTFGNDRDNIVPMQHQKMPYPLGANKNCKVCHTVNMADEMHHPNSLAMFRNIR